MRKVKIVDELDLARGSLRVVHSNEYQAAINRMFKEIAEESGSIVQTTYLRNRDGRVKTAIIEYEVSDE